MRPGQVCAADTPATGAAASIGPVAVVARIIKQIIGVPDYERYIAHQRATHPGCDVLSREAFMRERLEARYNRPGSKCC